MREGRASKKMPAMALFLLISLHAPARAIDEQPLWSAVQAGDLARVEELLRQTPAMIREVHSGRPVLHWTSDAKMIRLLVSHHADIGARDGEGLSPIEAAAQRGDLAALEALQPKKADLNVLSPSAQFPLLFGIRADANREAVVKFLLERGANPNLFSGYSTLWEAVDVGDARVIRLLLDYGANLHGLDGSPILAKVRSTNLNLLKFLLEQGKRVDPEFEFDDRSLLYIVPGPYPAESRASVEEVRKYDQAALPAVQFLAENGADKNAASQEGYVLDQAESSGLVSIASYLRKIGAMSLARSRENCNVEAHTGIRASPKKRVSQYHCYNNVWDCDDSVNQALRQAEGSRWGPFDFQCAEGRVVRLYVSTSSAIRSDWVGFIRENPQLFNLGASPEFQLQKGNRSFQYYQGLPVNYGIHHWERIGEGLNGDENWVEFLVSLTDTSGWQFSPQFAVDRDEAVAIAKKYFEPHRPREVSDWRVIAVSSSIRTNVPPGSDCPPGPAAVWHVMATGEFTVQGVGNAFGKSMEAFVDAKSGMPCSFSGTGEDYRRKRRRG